MMPMIDLRCVLEGGTPVSINGFEFYFREIEPRMSLIYK